LDRVLPAGLVCLRTSQAAKCKSIRRRNRPWSSSHRCRIEHRVHGCRITWHIERLTTKQPKLNEVNVNRMCVASGVDDVPLLERVDVWLLDLRGVPEQIVELSHDRLAGRRIGNHNQRHVANTTRCRQFSDGRSAESRRNAACKAHRAGYSELHQLAEEDTTLPRTSRPVRERGGRIVLELYLCARRDVGEVQKNISALTGCKQKMRKRNRSVQHRSIRSDLKHRLFV